MKYIFNKEKNAQIKNNVEYSFTFNGRNCSFSIDEIYLKSDIKKRTIVFNPPTGWQPNDNYYMFCQNIIGNVVKRIATGKLKNLDKIIIDVADNFIDYTILEAE